MKARGLGLDAQLNFSGLGQEAGRYGVRFVSKKTGSVKTEWYVTENHRDTAFDIMRSQGHKVEKVRR